MVPHMSLGNCFASIATVGASAREQRQMRRQASTAVFSTSGGEFQEATEVLDFGENLKMELGKAADKKYDCAGMALAHWRKHLLHDLVADLRAALGKRNATAHPLRGARALFERLRAHPLAGERRAGSGSEVRSDNIGEAMIQDKGGRPPGQQAAAQGDGKATVQDRDGIPESQQQATRYDEKVGVQDKDSVPLAQRVPVVESDSKAKTLDKERAPVPPGYCAAWCQGQRP